MLDKQLRIGNGYDIHRLEPGRKLILGGVQIPYKKGLLGHSDADVLLHAIIDAMLGAATLGDIGRYFPPDDPKYKNISSIELVKKVKILINNANYSVINVDSTIIAEKPRMSGHILDMRMVIANALDIELKDVSVKATTMEGLGAIGEGKAIAASAVVLLGAISE